MICLERVHRLGRAQVTAYIQSGSCHRKGECKGLVGACSAVEPLPRRGDIKWLVCWAWKGHMGEECWPRGLCPQEGTAMCVLLRSVRLERGRAEADGANLLCDSLCGVLSF